MRLDESQGKDGGDGGKLSSPQKAASARKSPTTSSKTSVADEKSKTPQQLNVRRSARSRKPHAEEEDDEQDNEEVKDDESDDEYKDEDSSDTHDADVDIPMADGTTSPISTPTAPPSSEDSDSEQEMNTFPVVITTYEMIIRDRIHLAQYDWGYIVVDEGHRLKNLDCKLMQEIKKYPSAGRMILTGTPLHVSFLFPFVNLFVPWAK